MSIQPLDQALIEALRLDPRMSNRAIADTIGVTQQTVASRLRALIDAKVIRILLQRDFGHAGFAMLAFAEIGVGPAPARDVAAILSAMPEIFSVAVCPGTPEIIANVNVHTAAALADVRERIASIPGVSTCRLTTARKVERMILGSGDLETEIAPLRPMLPQEPLDDAIMHMLVIDGRLSNREIARQTGVSEGTVRARLRRLHNDNVIRISVVCDPHKLGLNHTAYIFLNGTPHAIDEALETMKRHREISFLASAEGAHDAVLVGVAAEATTLPQLCAHDLRQIPGMGDISFRPILHTAKHRFDYVHIGENDAIA